jgi:hypothetical protein
MYNCLALHTVVPGIGATACNADEAAEAEDDACSWFRAADGDNGFIARVVEEAMADVPLGERPRDAIPLLETGPQVGVCGEPDAVRRPRRIIFS